MKTLIPLIFAILALSCDEVIEYRDRIVYEKIPYKVATFSGYSLDTVIARKVKPRTIYRDSIIHVHDTVYIDSIVYIEKIVEVPVIVYDTIVEVRIDTVERESEITYLPMFEPFVANFFEKRGGQYAMGQLDIDIKLDTIPDDLAHYSTDAFGQVEDGGMAIYFKQDGCYEGAIYRELLHFLFARDYVGFYDPAFADDPAIDHIMVKNWPRCIENMNQEERDFYLAPIF